MLELVIVLVIAGILSYTAMGRLNNTGEVNAHGFAEQVASLMRFTQQASIAQRRTLYVNVNASSGLVNACLDSAAACAQPLSGPGGASLAAQAPSGVALTTTLAQFTFDALGRPSAAAQVQVTISSSSGQTFSVTVEPDSGYVRRS